MQLNKPSILCISFIYINLRNKQISAVRRELELQIYKSAPKNLQGYKIYKCTKFTNARILRGQIYNGVISCQNCAREMWTWLRLVSSIITSSFLVSFNMASQYYPAPVHIQLKEEEMNKKYFAEWGEVLQIFYSILNPMFWAFSNFKT